MRAARAWADIDSPDLADQLGVSIRTVQRWESGVNAPPTEVVEAVAILCGVPQSFVRGELPGVVDACTA